MRLSRTDITSYRSIKSQKVTFTPRGRVLVGINESGKSNVLNALATLAPRYKTTPSDERQSLPDEDDQPDKAQVLFVFSLEKDDYDSIGTNLSQKVYAKPNTKALNDGSKDMTVASLAKFFREGLYAVDIREGTKHPSYWNFERSTYTLVGDWSKPSKACPDDFSFTSDDGEKVILKEKSILKLSPKELETIPAEYIEAAAVGDLFTQVINAMTTHVSEHLPEVIFWEYTDKDFLPNHVSLAKFIEDPDSHTPLKNMFGLAGINNIADEIKREKNKGPTQLNNLLKRVALSATNYLEQVWQEYKGVKFSMQMNGANIQCSITEENDFPFKDRSDGFKKFIAFLLSVSSTSHTGRLVNALILIDEPEIGLHPSGARYLRDELLKISKTNYVVYSTHSIFMIDRHEIERHYIVKKQRETTSLQVGSADNIVDEEVIFNAINYSTFEHLKEVNVLFEGWRDKRLFMTYTKTYEKAYFDKIGIGHGKGVPSFRSLVPTLELAERKLVIISDNDNAAKNAQKDFIKLGHQTEWKTYVQVSPTTTAVTGEDFLKNDYIVEKFKKVSAGSGIEISLVSSSLPENSKLNYLKGQLLQNGRTEIQATEAIEELKKELFGNSLSKGKIEDRYSSFIDDIKTHLESNLK